MIIRTQDQRRKLSHEDQERWRTNAMSEIIHSLAKNFSVQELAIVQHPHMAAAIVRAGYKINDYLHLQEKSGESEEIRIAFDMADHLRMTFLSLELVWMDGYYATIFHEALPIKRERFVS